MNHIKTHLFIGGFMDGQRKEVSPRIEEYKFVVFPEPLVPVSILDDTKQPIRLETAEYRRASFKAGDSIFDMWLLASMKTDDAMRLLLANYRPDKKAVTP